MTGFASSSAVIGMRAGSCRKDSGASGLPLAPHPCPECEERKTTALNYISLTFEFEQLQAECEKLKAELEREHARLRKLGFRVEVVDSIAGVDALAREA